jgi:hypothetical protein
VFIRPWIAPMKRSNGNTEAGVPVHQDDVGLVRVDLLDGFFQPAAPRAVLFIRLAFERMDVHEDVRLAAARTIIEAEEDAFQAEGFSLRFHPARLFLAKLRWGERLLAMGTGSYHGASPWVPWVTVRVGKRCKRSAGEAPARVFSLE